MDMNNKIINVKNESKKYDEMYNSLLINILSNAETLVDMSNGVYQIEHTIRANKISLKDYVLNSDICAILRSNNINNYSIEELRNYISKYNSQSTTPYTFALNLYEDFEKLEKCEKDKVEYELNSLNSLIDISNIGKLSKEELDSLYEQALMKVKTFSLNAESEAIVKLLVNDIINYYKYGNKEIHIGSSNENTNNLNDDLLSQN